MILCLDAQRHLVTTTPPLSIIHLKDGCQAVSSAFKLPLQLTARSMPSSNVLQDRPFVLPINISQAAIVQRLKAIHNIPQYPVQIPHHLRGMPVIPITALSKDVSTNLIPLRINDHHNLWSTTAFISLSCLVIIGLAMGLITLKCGCCHQCKCRAWLAQRWHSIPTAVPADDSVAPPEICLSEPAGEACGMVSDIRQPQWTPGGIGMP